MKEIRNSRVFNSLSIFLILLCLGVMIIPPNLLHSHKEADLGCDAHLAIENDLCHIKIYHSNDTTRKACDHENHIDSKVSKCEFCKFLGSTKKSPLHLSANFVKFKTDEKESSPPYEVISYFSLGNADFGRAPPVL